MASQPPPYGQLKVSTPKQAGLSWIACSKGFIPQRAIEAGPGVYVARSLHKGFLIPGKAVHGHQKAYCSYDGKEHSESSYEILCDTSLPMFGACYSWQLFNAGSPLPPNALVGGYESDNEPLYIARSVINGETVVGKVKVSHNCAYFPWGGNEHSRQQFELLTVY